MKNFKKLQCFLFLLLKIHCVTPVAVASFEQACPCLGGQSCLLSCSNSSGVVVNGLSFSFESFIIVSCLNRVCNSADPNAYIYTPEHDGKAFLQIVQFDNSTLSGNWRCQDGTGNTSSKYIIQTDSNDIPSGNLSISAPSDVAPVVVTCTIDHIGAGQLVLTYPGSVTTNASNTVSTTVMEAATVNCTVEWTDFPNCDRYTFSPQNITIQGFGCSCPCKCTIVIALVITLAILTAALLGCTLYLGFRPGGIWREDERKRPEQREIFITVFLIVATGIFVIAVGAYSLNCYRQCKDEGIKTNPGCFDAYCPEAYDASIAFVALGSLVVIFAIVVLVLSCLCRPGKDPQPLCRPGKDPQPIFLKRFVLVHFIKEKKTCIVRREQLNLGITSFGLEMFWASWPVEDPEQSAEAGATPLRGQKLSPVGIISSTDDRKHASQELKKEEKCNGPEPPETDIILETKGKDLNNGFTQNDFVLVEIIMSKERHIHIVYRSSIELRKCDTGLESFTAALAPKDRKTHAKKKTPPSDQWERIPVMILGSADDFQPVEEALENFLKAEERNKGNCNPESQNERILSPGRKLPPLHREENTDTGQPPSENRNKKEKAKKDQPESEKPRPLPTPSQPMPQTQRRPSTGAHVNMSASNNSPLPIMSTITPGHPASGQSGNALPPIGSSSFKKNQVGP